MEGEDRLIDRLCSERTGIQMHSVHSDVLFLSGLSPKEVKMARGSVSDEEMMELREAFAKVGEWT